MKLWHPLRVAARQQGLKHWQPDQPCRRGHHAMRYVQSNCCVQCMKTHNKGAYWRRQEEVPMVPLVHIDRDWRPTVTWRKQDA